MATDARALQSVESAPNRAAEKAAIFVSESAEFALDQTIAPETRFLVGILYRKAALQLAAERVQDGLKRLGTEPFDVVCSYDELVALTPWNRSQIAKILASSKPLIEIHGSPRGGYRYRVNVIMRTYRMATDGPIAPSILKENRPQPAAANRRKQMALGDDLSSTIELKTDRPDNTLSSTIGLKKRRQPKSLSSAIELKTNQSPETLSPTIELKTAGLSSSIEPKTTALSSIDELNNSAIKGHARDVRVLQEYNNNGDDVPEALQDELLLLYRVKDKNAQRTSLPFRVSIESLLDLISENRSCDRETAIGLLAQIAADPSWRSSSFTDPIAFIRKNIDKLLGLRLAVASAPPAGPRETFFALPIATRAAVVVAVADGAATTEWLRSANVPREAAKYARELLAHYPGIASRVKDGDIHEIQEQEP